MKIGPGETQNGADLRGGVPRPEEAPGGKKYRFGGIQTPVSDLPDRLLVIHFVHVVLWILTYPSTVPFFVKLACLL